MEGLCNAWYCFALHCSRTKNQMTTGGPIRTPALMKSQQQNSAARRELRFCQRGPACPWLPGCRKNSEKIGNKSQEAAFAMLVSASE